MNVVCTESITPMLDLDPIKTDTRQIEPLRGTPARLVAQAQGKVWEGIVGTAAISEHVATVECLDRRGDLLMREHRNLLARAAATARREGAPQTAAMLYEAIAQAQLLDELDTHEDAHRQQIDEHADGAGRHLRQASTVQSALLGQKPSACGRVRASDNGVVFSACPKDAGHPSACFFEAVATAPASLP